MAIRPAGGCITVHPSRASGAVYWEVVAVTGLVSLVCLTGFVSELSDRKLGPALGFLVGAVAVGGVSALYVYLVRQLGPVRPLVVCPDRIQLGRDAGEVQSAARPAIGLVFVSTFLHSRAPTVQTISIFGPDHALVEQWTGMRPFSSRRVMRALTRAGYPWVREIRTIDGRRSTRRSPLVPAWADEVLRP